MFRYFVARMSTMLLTTNQLLRLARRREIRALRQKGELVAKLAEKLRNDIQRGDMDKLFDDVVDGVEKFEELRSRLLRLEKYVVIAEGRGLEKLKPVDEVFSVLLKMELKFPDLKPQIEAVHEPLHRILEMERQLLSGQYYAVERQAQDLKGTIQNLVLTENVVRAGLDALWNERTELRMTKKEDKEALKDEEVILNILKKAGSPEKLTSSQRKILDDRLAVLKKIANQLLIYYTKVMNDFVTIVKSFVEIVFQIEKDERENFARLEAELQKTGYPTTGKHSLAEISGLLHKSEDDVKEKEKILETVMQRMARVTLGEAVNL